MGMILQVFLTYPPAILRSSRLPRMFDEAEGRGKPMANAQLRLGCSTVVYTRGGGGSTCRFTLEVNLPPF